MKEKCVADNSALQGLLEISLICSGQFSITRNTNILNNLLTFSTLSGMFSVGPLSSHLSTPPEALVSEHLKTLSPLNYYDLYRLMLVAKLCIYIIVISIFDLAHKRIEILRLQ